MKPTRGDFLNTESTISVLVVDDSAVFRMVIGRLLSTIEGVRVLGSAENGQAALEKIAQLKPDVVTLDVEMPVLDGLATLRRVRAEFPEILVIMVAGSNPNSAQQTMEALSLGALDFIAKPFKNGQAEGEQKLKESFLHAFEACKTTRAQIRARKALRAAVEAPARKPAAAPLGPAARRARAKPPETIDAVLMGASTGGPKALETVIAGLPANFPAPVLVVVHMPPLFTHSFAKSLDAKAALDVSEAVDGQRVEPGHVYIALGGRHLRVKKMPEGFRQLELAEDAPVNSCRPAVDVLFMSAAEAYAPGRTLSVILTGMGADGLQGVRQLSQKGGYCLTQSERSCVVYGMPRSVEEAGLADEVLDLDDIGRRLTQIIAARKGP